MSRFSKPKCQKAQGKHKIALYKSTKTQGKSRFFPQPKVLWVSLTPIPECQGLQCWNHTFSSPSVHQTIFVIIVVIIRFFCFKANSGTKTQ